MNRRRPLWLVLLVASSLVLLSRPATGAGHAAASGAAAAASSSAASSAAASSTRGRHRAPRRHALLHPTHKYFGAFASGVPYTLKNLDTVATKVHKQPRIGGYFLDWTHEFNVAANQRTCDAGVTPYVTWESWSWENQRHGSPAFSQPKYAPRRIAAGSRDHVIRRTAKQIRQVHCTVMLRLDHEPNGYWYPWGLATKGMHNKAHDYVRMWRHVWRIFHRQHVHNVIWVWSPNYLYPGGTDHLGGLYPGKRYVDMVAIDGYLLHRGDTAGKVFGPVLRRLRHIAPHRPWFVGETGAPANHAQPRRIRMLLHKVAKTRRLVGFSYFNEPGSRATWSFTNRPASVAAFRHAIAGPAYGGHH